MRRSTTPQTLRRSRALPSALGILLFFAAGAAAQSSSPSLAQKKAAAKAQFDRADKLRTALDGRPQNERTLKEYNAVVAAYRRVYLITPHATEVTPSLVAIAELYQEMGRRFDPKYFQSAIDAYQYLLHEYPGSRYRDDALFTIGQIQRQEQNQLDLAEQTFKDFLKRFPASPKAEQVKQALEGIATAREEERKAASREAVAERRAQQLKMPRVTNIRHWNADNSTRVVVDLEDRVEYQAHRIGNPERIYFDLHKAALSPTLAGKTLEIQRGFLNTIRVAQNQAGVVRVVLEVDKVQDYSVFLIDNPPRLVVDVYGPKPQPERIERAAAPPPVKSEAVPGPAEKPAEPSAEKKEEATVLAAAKERSGPPPAPPTPAQPNKNGQHSLTRALGLKISRIVIDPGHGGHDTGTIGPTGLMEKDLALDLALRLSKMIREQLPGTEVILTREDDTFVPLESRTAIANQAKADLFLSIHANASRDRQARGVETYYLSFASSDEAMEVAARENALSQSSIHELQDIIKKIARNEKIEESRELALELQQALAGRLQRVSRYNKDRGVKKAPFVVLIGANMPSVLSEVSFLSNPTDELMMKKPEHRDRIAEGLFNGVQIYLQNLNSLAAGRLPAADTNR
jgi:N-acetylmuramoyl-L-alanine amidase